VLEGLRKVDGDTAKYALDNKLVDALGTSAEIEKSLSKQFGWSKTDNNYRAISYYDYNVKTPSDEGSAIAVIFANGAINAAVYLAKKEPGLYNMGDLIASI
jgi:protease-4